MTRSFICGFFMFSVFSLTIAIKVSIYYEALCPDSVSFIKKQLYPNYSELQPYIELDFVPYGKAIHYNKDEKIVFSCQHGPQECIGNKFQACALSQNKGQKNDLEFVNCVMKTRRAANLANVETCAKKYNFDFEKIRSCADSTEGDVLLAEKGNQTLSLDPNISFVPTIVFNDSFDQTSQDQALEDFTAVVCSKIVTGSKPHLCENRKLPNIDSGPSWNWFN